MRTWGWLFAALGWSLCVFAGFLALFLAFEPITAPHLLKAHGSALWNGLAGDSESVEHRVALWLLGSGLILGPALVLVMPLARWRYRRHIEFASESGAVLIDVSSMEECLRKVLSEEEGVGRARVDLKADRAELLCNVTVWLEAASDVVGRVGQIEKRISEYYDYVLPESKPLKVVTRTRLIYQRRPGAGTAGRKDADPAQAVREESRNDDYYGGPRYPVDASDVDPGSMTSS